MARQVNGEPPGDLIRYVPKPYGNREAEPEDTVVVWYRAPTERQKRKIRTKNDHITYASDENGMPVKDEDGKPIIRIEMGAENAKDEEILTKFVERVDNYVNPKGEPINTGPLLVEHGEPHFISDISLKIRSGLVRDADKKKKQSEQQSSPSQTQENLTGTARPAERAALISQETAMAGAIQTTNTSSPTQKEAV